MAKVSRETLNIGHAKPVPNHEVRLANLEQEVQKWKKRYHDLAEKHDAKVKQDKEYWDNVHRDAPF